LIDTSPGWANEPELLVRVDAIPNEELWGAHVKAKKELLDFIRQRTGKGMDIDALTLGFARRATEYKRGTLIFSDLKKLREATRQGRIQLVFAGKAHPRDEMGKKMIEDLFGYIDRLKNEIDIAYLENYNMEMSAKLTSGVDVWLNTPCRPTRLLEQVA
jgi:starch phosphorylase